MVMEMTVVCSGICSKAINALCGERAEVLNAELDGTYSNCSILKGYCGVGASCRYIVWASCCTHLIGHATVSVLFHFLRCQMLTMSERMRERRIEGLIKNVIQTAGGNAE
jgi:hypothetical protein